MTTCVTCGCYFKQSEYNDSEECYDCVDTLDEIPPLIDSVYEADVHEILHPTGRTMPKFEE